MAISCPQYGFLLLLLLLWLGSNSPTPVQSADFMVGGTELGPDVSLRVPQYHLVFRPKWCRLELIYTPSATIIWSSNNTAVPAFSRCHCLFTDYGTLEIVAAYKKELIIQWASSVRGRRAADYRLVLGNDGNMVIFGKLVWGAVPAVVG